MESGALASAGLCTAQPSSAVVVVHRGDVIAERYWAVDDWRLVRVRKQLWGTTEAGAPVEDVASMQKSVVSVLVGIAVNKGRLALDESVST